MNGNPALRRRRSLTRRTLLLAAGLGLGAAAAAQAPAPPVVVTAATLTRLAPTSWYPGTVIARNQARLAAEEAGRLEWVADVGARIAAGEVVARMDDALLRQEVAAAEAQAASERARIGFLRKEVERLRSLARTNIATQSQLDQAVANLGVSQSELAAFEARVALIAERLRRTVTRAPFDGVVTERLQQAGEWADSGATLVRLVDAEALEVQARVPVNALEFMRPGSRLRLAAGEREASGEVRTIVPVGDDRSRLYELRIGLPAGTWPAGQTLRVAIPTARPREVVAVPRDALVLRREGTTVFRVGEDGTAEAVRVETGIAEGDLIGVTGIEAGDRVVIRGGERLRPGQAVQVMPATGEES